MGVSFNPPEAPAELSEETEMGVDGREGVREWVKRKGGGKGKGQGGEDWREIGKDDQGKGLGKRWLEKSGKGREWAKEDEKIEEIEGVVKKVKNDENWEIGG